MDNVRTQKTAYVNLAIIAVNVAVFLFLEIGRASCRERV